MGRDHPNRVAVPAGLFAGEAAAIADGPVVGEPVEIETLDVRMAHLVTAHHRAVEELDGDVVGRERPEMDLRDHLPFLPEIDLGGARVAADVDDLTSGQAATTRCFQAARERARA